MKKHPHETTVLGLFKTPELAHSAMDALESIDISHDDISYVAGEEAYEKEELVNFIAGEKLHGESVRSGKIGGLTGAVLAGATMVTGVLTGGGSLLATGPLIAVVTGAGGIIGGLIGTGFKEEEAKKVDNAIHQGEVMVVVHAANRHTAHQAKDLLQGQGADLVHSHH